MPTPTVIGAITKDSNGENATGKYSHRAFKKGTAANGDYSTTWLDLGFRPQQIYIENKGSNPLEIVFKHEIEGDPSIIPNRVDSEIATSDARMYRERNHRLIGLRGQGGAVDYQVEAW